MKKMRRAFQLGICFLLTLSMLLVNASANEAKAWDKEQKKQGTIKVQVYEVAHKHIAPAANAEITSLKLYNVNNPKEIIELSGVVSEKGQITFTVDNKYSLFLCAKVTYNDKTTVITPLSGRIQQVHNKIYLWVDAKKKCPCPTATPTAPIETETPAPSVPAETETPEPSVPAETETPAPSVPAETETPEPSIPAETETPEPSVPAETETPEPSVPVETETPEPSVPVETETPEPSVPAETETPEPSETADVPVDPDNPDDPSGDVDIPQPDTPIDAPKNLPKTSTVLPEYFYLVGCGLIIVGATIIVVKKKVSRPTE